MKNHEEDFDALINIARVLRVRTQHLASDLAAEGQKKISEDVLIASDKALGCQVKLLKALKKTLG